MSMSSNKSVSRFARRAGVVAVALLVTAGLGYVSGAHAATVTAVSADSPAGSQSGLLPPGFESIGDPIDAALDPVMGPLMNQIDPPTRGMDPRDGLDGPCAHDGPCTPTEIHPGHGTRDGAGGSTEYTTTTVLIPQDPAPKPHNQAHGHSRHGR